MDYFVSDGWQTVSNGYQDPATKKKALPKDLKNGTASIYRDATVAANSYFNIRVGAGHGFNHAHYEGPVLLINSFDTLGEGYYGKASSPIRTWVHSDINKYYDSNGKYLYSNASSYGKISAACFVNTLAEVTSVQNNITNWGIYYNYDIRTIVRNKSRGGVLVKKIILIFLYSCIIFSAAFCEDSWRKELKKNFYSEDVITVLYNKNTGSYLYGENENFVKINSSHEGIIPIKFSLKNDLKLNDETGYLSFNHLGKSILFIPSEGLYKTVVLEKKNQNFSLVDSQEDLHLKKSDYSGDIRQYTFNLENIKVSSYLIEKTKNGVWKYDGQDIERFPILSSEDTNGNNCKYISMPWVEGKDDDGIGEWIEFEVPALDTLFFVNGFVDVHRPHLYKENNRIETATLVCTPEDKNKQPFEIKIEFKDFVYTKAIEIPECCSKFKFVIDSVYKGLKYSDTVLTSIYTLGTVNDI